MLIYGLASKSQRLVRQDLYQGFTLTPHFTGSSAGRWGAGQFKPGLRIVSVLG